MSTSTYFLWCFQLIKGSFYCKHHSSGFILFNPVYVSQNAECSHTWIQWITCSSKQTATHINHLFILHVASGYSAHASKVCIYQKWHFHNILQTLTLKKKKNNSLLGFKLTHHSFNTTDTHCLVRNRHRDALFSYRKKIKNEWSLFIQIVNWLLARSHVFIWCRAALSWRNIFCQGLINIQI